MKKFVYRPSRKRNGKTVKARLNSGRYRLPGDPKETRVPLHVTDKRVAQLRLDKMVADIEREREGLIASKVLRDAAVKSVEAHCIEYLADLRAQEWSGEYVRKVDQRLSSLRTDCSWERIADITAESFVAWRSTCEVGTRTRNHYLEAAMTFCEWLVRQGRTDTNPLATVRKVETRGDEKRRERRALTDDESRELLRVSGVRAPVYLLALHTGLRRGEIAQMRWGDLDLTSTPATIRARAATTKNHKDAVLALVDELADALRQMRPEKASSAATVFKGIMPSSRTFKADLERAKIDPRDELGRVVDFHALRHTFGTNLQRTGVSHRVAMEMMRHSDARPARCV
jgi:integrase